MQGKSYDSGNMNICLSYTTNRQPGEPLVRCNTLEGKDNSIVTSIVFQYCKTVHIDHNTTNKTKTLKMIEKDNCCDERDWL
jgi:hypothetical protein